MKLTFWLKLSTDKGQGKDMVGEAGARTTGSCSVSDIRSRKDKKQVNELSNHKSGLFTKNMASRISGIGGAACLLMLLCHGIPSADM